MNDFVKLKPIDPLERVLRLALDAKHLAETMSAGEAVSVWLIVEDARDNLSRVLERAKKELQP